MMTGMNLGLYGYRPNKNYPIPLESSKRRIDGNYYIESMANCLRKVKVENLKTQDVHETIRRAR
jgi:hypothetical protein